MKNTILFFSLFILLSCKIDHSKTKLNSETVLAEIPKSEVSMQPVYGPNLPSEPYELILDVHKLSNGIYDLEIQMLLYNNAYYASPNAKGDLSGKFAFFVNNNDFFILKNNFIETPLTNKNYDSSTNDKGLTSWVGVNTSYKQKLEITTTEDFEINGFIQFTIEPRCTFEKIPVIIKCKNGVVKFEINNC
ncbi:hypothetical protein [Flavobacterium sp.]|jgi:hypothetical protein|uniref:hypothetical protein n=1 Tax=Flavobacterium sp. TaxID=239 RepID=UPI002A7F1186|nr:hypothetical protein [Flavobacterium sp.]